MLPGQGGRAAPSAAAVKPVQKVNLMIKPAYRLANENRSFADNECPQFVFNSSFKAVEKIVPDPENTVKTTPIYRLQNSDDLMHDVDSTVLGSSWKQVPHQG